MVTTTAFLPFLARIPSGTAAPRLLPASLLQSLMQADPSGKQPPPPPPPPPPPQPGCCCLAGPAGSARPAALKRAKRRRGEIVRPSPGSGLLPSRFQQYQQLHRAALGRRNPPIMKAPPATPSGAGLEATLSEEAAVPRPAPAKPGLRKEVFINKMGKSDKINIPYSRPVHSIHLCERSKTNRQRSKCDTNKIPPTKKMETLWQESVSPGLIKKQTEKPLKNTENIKTMKAKKPILLMEANQKENYAGAKFSDPPSPSLLPKPPSHWVGSTVEYSDQNKEMMAVHLKTLLKVQV